MNAVRMNCKACGKPLGIFDADICEECIEKALKRLNKTAHWDNITCRCSNCGLAVTYSEAVSGKYKYCYNCGSRMEGGTHEKVD